MSGRRRAGKESQQPQKAGGSRYRQDRHQERRNHQRPEQRASLDTLDKRRGGHGAVTILRRYVHHISIIGSGVRFAVRLPMIDNEGCGGMPHNQCRALSDPPHFLSGFPFARCPSARHGDLPTPT